MKKLLMTLKPSFLKKIKNKYHDRSHLGTNLYECFFAFHYGVMFSASLLTGANRDIIKRTATSFTTSLQ